MGYNLAVPETSTIPSFLDRLTLINIAVLRRLADPRLALALFAVVFVTAAVARAVAAPLSATQDMAQFWSFAQLFKEHGLDFYQYAGGTEPTNPWQGWGYVYPPIWVLLLGLALAAVPAADAGQEFVDTAWRVAMKTPIIAADLIIGVILFIAVPGSRWKKLLFASLWLLNPAAWYNSSVFGQFDAIAAAFLIGSLVLLERGQDRWAFAVAALAVMTKQHTAIPLAFMMVVTLRTMPWRRFAGNLAIFTGIIAAFSLPFMVTGNAEAYVRAVLLPGQAPTYQDPLIYAFSGSGALLTYLHNVNGWDTVGWLQYNTPGLIIAIVGGLALSYLLRLSPLRAMLVGFLLFIAIFYRINYQYLVIFIPLALLAAARTTYWSERIIGLGLAVFPAVWLWFFNVSFWFYYLTPAYPATADFLNRFGWTSEISADRVYVAIAMTITLLSLAYIAFAFARWRQPSSPTRGR